MFFSHSKQKYEWKYQTVQDFSRNPVEIFDGSDGKSVIFKPTEFGIDYLKPQELLVQAEHVISDFKDIKTIQNESKGYFNLLSEKSLENLFMWAPIRVPFFNPSGQYWEVVPAYYAFLSKDSDKLPCLVVHFSYWEVQAGRYHAYVYKLLEIRK